jgi:hypothetical protein
VHGAAPGNHFWRDCGGPHDPIHFDRCAIESGSEAAVCGEDVVRNFTRIDWRIMSERIDELLVQEQSLSTAGGRGDAQRNGTRKTSAVDESNNSNPMRRQELAKLTCQ